MRQVLFWELMPEVMDIWPEAGKVLTVFFMQWQEVQEAGLSVL